MKNLNIFMALALFFIYLCKRFIQKLAAGFPKQICYAKEDLSKPKNFIYYRIVDVLTICLITTPQYRRWLSKIERSDQFQMKIRLI